MSMLRLIAYMHCQLYYRVGCLVIYLAAYDCLSDIAYSVYNECMHRSIDINDRYFLNVWKRP